MTRVDSEVERACELLVRSRRAERFPREHISARLELHADELSMHRHSKQQQSKRCSPDQRGHYLQRHAHKLLQNARGHPLRLGYGLDLSIRARKNAGFGYLPTASERT